MWVVVQCLIPSTFFALSSNVYLVPRFPCLFLLFSLTQNPRLLDEGTTERPDYQRCIAISTRAALKYMVPPGALVMLAPLITGTFFGVMAVAGLLTGKLQSNQSIQSTNFVIGLFIL